MAPNLYKDMTFLKKEGCQIVRQATESQYSSISKVKVWAHLIPNFPKKDGAAPELKDMCVKLANKIAPLHQQR